MCTFAFECDRNDQAAIGRLAATAGESGTPPCQAYWYTPAGGLREITLEQASFLASDLYETMKQARQEAVQMWAESLEQGRLAQP